MYYVTAQEMEKNIAQMLSQVAEGAEFVITKEGKPIAALKSTAENSEDQILARRKEIVKKILEMRDKNGTVDLDKIMRKVRAGRRW